jgi:hypothetical protein
MSEMIYLRNASCEQDISAENTKNYEQSVTDGIQLECDMNDIHHEVEAPLPS